MMRVFPGESEKILEKLTISENIKGLTVDENLVLAHSSMYNEHKLVPFTSTNVNRKFRRVIPYADPDGFLKLSEAQKRQFSRWCRPKDIFPEPKIIAGQQIDFNSIKQHCVANSSFIAALIVAAQLEKRANQKFISAIIYPRNSENEPIYNPAGMYVIKININGIERQVTVDDYLPVNAENQLLCAHSTKPGELWVSLIEKAYMKIMGGYDCNIGSCSERNVAALTGWIPDMCDITADNPDFRKEDMFKSMLHNFRIGCVLITLSTRILTDEEISYTKLRSYHSYAVIEVRDVDGIRLLKLRDTCREATSRLKFSNDDPHNWFPELEFMVNFDPDYNIKNGIFWVDYDNVCRFFGTVHLNWCPNLFPFALETHRIWSPATFSFSSKHVGSNPQFSITVPPEAKGDIWILLTRHLNNSAEENAIFTYLSIYCNGGRRVQYYGVPCPHIPVETRYHSRHYLSKIQVNPESSRQYTVVISSSIEDSIFYTFRAFGTFRFKTEDLYDPYKYEKQISDSEWKLFPKRKSDDQVDTSQRNPRFELTVSNSTRKIYLFVVLESPAEESVGFKITSPDGLNDLLLDSSVVIQSERQFQRDVAFLELENVPAGSYNIVPIKNSSKQSKGRFTLKCKSSSKIELVSLKSTELW